MKLYLVLFLLAIFCGVSLGMKYCPGDHDHDHDHDHDGYTEISLSEAWGVAMFAKNQIQTRPKVTPSPSGNLKLDCIHEAIKLGNKYKVDFEAKDQNGRIYDFLAQVNKNAQGNYRLVSFEQHAR